MDLTSLQGLLVLLREHGVTEYSDEKVSVRLGAPKQEKQALDERVPEPDPAQDRLVSKLPENYRALLRSSGG